MILSIDTTNPERVTLTLTGNSREVGQIFKTDHNLSENLIPEIKKFLTKQKVKLNDLTQIEAAMGEGHFSRIRTAVATANALAFGIGLAQKPVKPIYSQLALTTFRG